MYKLIQRLVRNGVLIDKQELIISDVEASLVDVHLLNRHASIYYELVKVLELSEVIAESKELRNKQNISDKIHAINRLYYDITEFNKSLRRSRSDKTIKRITQEISECTSKMDSIVAELESLGAQLERNSWGYSLIDNQNEG